MISAVQIFAKFTFPIAVTHDEHTTPFDNTINPRLSEPLGRMHFSLFPALTFGEPPPISPPSYATTTAH